MKKPHQTLLASFVRSVLHALQPRMPLTVCLDCVRVTDELLHEHMDGDSVCDRCRASVKETLAIRVPAGGSHGATVRAASALNDPKIPTKKKGN